MGRIEKAVLALFTKAATATHVSAVAEKFKLITLGGEALRGVSWVPGQKVQIQLGGFTQRTFTPLSWDSAIGSTELLAYVHGDAPAARWARTLEVGADCSIFGPRGSIDLSLLERPALLFGDETSFGLASALRATPGGADGVHVLLEVTSSSASQQALAAVFVTGAHLIERQSGDAHFTEVERVARELFGRHSIKGAALSGKASSIQMLKKTLSSFDLARHAIRSKAYWAPGKTGLD
jgi:ferric-chelate reductase (NADPH)